MTYNDTVYDIKMVIALGLIRDAIPDLDLDRCSRSLRALQDTIAEWNDFAHLVSAQDLRRLKAHIVDSLSLSIIVASNLGSNGVLLDIGSGGGFPAVVLKIVLPELRMVLLERDSKKAAFLTKLVGMFRFEDVYVLEGSFPTVVPDGEYRVITARAVQKPGVILPAIRRFLTPESAFIFQSPRAAEFFGEGFDVEVVNDEWDLQRLRRGTVRICRPSLLASE